MNLYKIRMYLKQNKFIHALYYKLSGKSNEKKKKSDALGSQGMSLAALVESTLRPTGYKYIIAFGNLLGLVRDGHFISYDDDVDYGICTDGDFSWEELERVLVQKGFRKERQFRIDGEIQEQTYRYEDLTVDFFGFHDGEAESIWHTFFRKDDYIYDNKQDMHISEAHFAPVGEVHRVSFDDVEMTLPVEPEALLESMYTKNWRIPDPNWSEKNCTNRFVLEQLGKKELFK